MSDGKRAGDFRSCWRTTADRAWAYPWLEWGRTPTSTAALILDLYSREAIERLAACAMGCGPLPRPSVTMEREASGHQQAAWVLRRPVHRYPGSRSKPRQLFSRISEFYAEHLDADAGYVGVLASNPVHGDYRALWRG